MKNTKGNVLVLLAALTWGFSFVGQQTGMEHMGAWSFTAVRFLFGSILLLIVNMFLDFKKHKTILNKKIEKEYNKAFNVAIKSGPMILATVIVQQYALQYTTIGKCAFICALYIFIVPLFEQFFGKKASKKMWIAIFMALVGMYIMSISGGIDNINKGDMLSLIVAVGYSSFIITVDRNSKDIETMKFTTIQFLIAGIIALIAAPFIEPGDINIINIKLSWGSIFVTGFFSTCVGYTLQMIGQKYTDANSATILLSSETIFSLLAGYIFLQEVLKPREYLGCVIMAMAIFISVLPEKKKLWGGIK